MSSLETAGADLGVWVTIAELAKRKQMSRQSMHERVVRLEREGRLVTRQEGRSRMVELASFDRAVGLVGDAAREIAVETRKALAAGGDGGAPNAATGALRDAQSERAQYDAKLKALDYAERTGQLVPVKGAHGIETALLKVSEQLVRELNAPLSCVTEIMDAARIGEPALRRVLRAMIRDMRTKIASQLSKIAGEAMEEQVGGVPIDIEDGE